MTAVHDEQLADLVAMPSQLNMPYTLTPGRATGIFLAELANHRLIASRHGDDGPTLVPAQDFSGDGEPATTFVELPAIGEVVAVTSTQTETIALIHVPGADKPMVHRIVDQAAGIAPGDQVEAVWAKVASGRGEDLRGFRRVGLTSPPDTPRDLTGDFAAPLEHVDYKMTLDFQHSYGAFYGTLFDEIKHSRRIRGVRCSDCRRVLVPPRAQCEVCYAPTAEWVDVPDTGTIQACSVVHIEFVGQRLKPPYIYAEIVLDGSSTRLIHMIAGPRAQADMNAVKPGHRVRAVWGEARTGSLADIDHFEVIEGDES